MKVCYTRSVVVDLNATLVLTDRDPQFRSRLDVYNYVCATRLAKSYGKFIRINESTVCY
mgnify:FL=1